MKDYRARAIIAACLLLVLLIGCGGAAETVEIATETVASQPEAAERTKPPPVVAANNTVAPTEDATEAAGDGAEAGGPGSAPALPTAIPTVVPTEAPPTEAATETPTAAPTAAPPTAAPVVVQPTAVPPTATAVPPTPTPQLGVNGLIASNFAIQPRANLVVDGKVWFEFVIANSTGGDVPFDALGVMPKKDGADRPEWYQHSYGGNNDVIPPDGLSWEDHIDLPEAGNYTLRMVVCFDGPACKQQTGTWHTISQEIPITIQ
jgi:hypothetical protein